MHKRCLKKFRALPKSYPTGASWTAKEKKELKIVVNEIMRVITNELKGRDIENKLKTRAAVMMLLFLLTIIKTE